MIFLSTFFMIFFTAFFLSFFTSFFSFFSLAFSALAFFLAMTSFAFSIFTFAFSGALSLAFAFRAESLAFFEATFFLDESTCARFFPSLTLVVEALRLSFLRVTLPDGFTILALALAFLSAFFACLSFAFLTATFALAFATCFLPDGADASLALATCSLALVFASFFF